MNFYLGEWKRALFIQNPGFGLIKSRYVSVSQETSSPHLPKNRVNSKKIAHNSLVNNNSLTFNLKSIRQVIIGGTTPTLFAAS